MLKEATLWRMNLLEYRSITHPLTTLMLKTACQPTVSPNPATVLTRPTLLTYKGMYRVVGIVLSEVTVNHIMIVAVHLMADT